MSHRNTSLYCNLDCCWFLAIACGLHILLDLSYMRVMLQNDVTSNIWVIIVCLERLFTITFINSCYTMTPTAVVCFCDEYSVPHFDANKRGKCFVRLSKHNIQIRSNDHRYRDNLRWKDLMPYKLYMPIQNLRSFVVIIKQYRLKCTA